MTRLLAILTLVSACFQAFAQQANLTPDHIKMGKAFEESGYLQKALDEYTAAKDTPKKAAALNGMASILSAIGQYDSVSSYLAQSRALDPSPENLIVNYQVEANYWKAKNQYDQALESLQLALDKAEKLNDTKNLALIFSNMGSIYFSHQPDKTVARDYILRSNSLIDSAVSYNLLARNYGRLANVAMATDDGPSAKMYLDRAYKIVQLSDNLPVKAYVIGSMAILASGEDRMEESIKYLEESISIKRKLNQQRTLQNDLLNISEAYMQVKDFTKAEKSLKEVGDIARSLNDVVYLKYYYERASMLDSLKGNYKGAYSNYKLAMRYKDSTFSAQHFRDVREIQEKYEAGQKEKTIAEKELEIEHQKYRQVVIIGASTVGLLVFVVVLIVLRARSKKQQNDLRLHTIVKTQEEVQQRIARDLHDGLVQVLGAAKMSLQAISPETEKNVLQKQIRNASDIIDEAVTEARSISHEVLPYSLLKDGLISALEELFARSFASYDFDHTPINVPEDDAINIYRIAQELVNNVKKHSEADRVNVSLKVIGQQIRFVFSDNGQGFDVNGISKGAGLSNMTTRAELMGGTISINSAAGKGTTTELIIPL